MLLISGIFLLYSSVVVPFQIFMWDYSDACNTFPTLILDVCIDTFFMVILKSLFREADGAETKLPQLTISRVRGVSEAFSN